MKRVDELPEDPERGVPYSVSYYGTSGEFFHRGRVYVIRTERDPLGWEVLDCETGRQFWLRPEHLPVWRGPSVAARKP